MADSGLRAVIRTPLPRSAESTVVFEDGNNEVQHPHALQASTSAQLRLHRDRADTKSDVRDEAISR
jgi:hypothetical protein